MFCSKCGAQVGEGAKFCPKCGAAQPAANTEVQIAPVTETKTVIDPKETKKFNFFLTKHLFFGILGAYKTTYTDLAITGDNVNVHKYNRTFLIKNGNKEFTFKISEIVSIFPTRKLSLKMIFGVIFGLIFLFGAFQGGGLWPGFIGLLLIVIGVIEHYDYFLTINFGHGTLAIPNELKDGCKELENYLRERNPKIQIIKNY